jgi:hypothetical protein
VRAALPARQHSGVERLRGSVTRVGQGVRVDPGGGCNANHEAVGIHVDDLF